MSSGKRRRRRRPRRSDLGCGGKGEGKKVFFFFLSFILSLFLFCELRWGASGSGWERGRCDAAGTHTQLITAPPTECRTTAEVCCRSADILRSNHARCFCTDRRKNVSFGPPAEQLLPPGPRSGAACDGVNLSLPADHHFLPSLMCLCGCKLDSPAD